MPPPVPPAPQSQEAHARELERQQALLQALWAQAPDDALQPWLKHAPQRVARGLATYRANAGAHAERALVGAFPTVQALIGEDAFAALARALWRACPPTQGDMARFGEALPSFIEREGGLPDAPYLADCARLDWLVARAESAADVPPDPTSLALLGSVDAGRLHGRLAPGFAVLRSAHPVVSIRRAHEEVDEAAQQARATAQAALRDARGELALVWRQGWKARAIALREADAQWCEALQGGATLGAALDRMQEGFDVERWLMQALQHGWLLGVHECAAV